MKYYRMLLTLSFVIAIFLGYWSNDEVFTLGIFDQNNFLPNKNISLVECFKKIFITNITVGIIILFLMSYFTGGLLAIFVMFINGFILGKLFLELILIQQVSLKVKILSIVHIPIELYAFLLFSFMSYNGFYLISDMLKNNRIQNKFFPKKRELLKPTFLLFIAAIIESLIMYYVIL